MDGLIGFPSSLCSHAWSWDKVLNLFKTNSCEQGVAGVAVSGIY